MAFEKGHAKMGGRQKGVQNKATLEAHHMIRAALDSVGGQEYLARCAEDPSDKVRAAFLSLVSKLVRKDIHVTGEIQTLVTIRRSFAGPKREDEGASD